MAALAKMGNLPPEMMQHMPIPPPPPGMPGAFPPGMPGFPGMPGMPGGVPGMPSLAMPGMPRMPGGVPGMVPPATASYNHRERSPHRKNEDEYSREIRQYSETRSRVKRESGIR